MSEQIKLNEIELSENQKWNLAGKEPYKFHPQASHVSPEYRDGWNAALDVVEKARSDDKAEILKLRAAIADKVAATTMVTGMAVQNGGVSIELEGGAAQILAESLAAQYAKGGGPNYMELTFRSKVAVPGERFVVTVQRCDGETPHQLRQKAEARIAELEASQDEAVRRDALLKLIGLKFRSGNSTPVERITLTRSEVDAAIATKEQPCKS
jgi:hypothetical protein